MAYWEWMVTGFKHLANFLCVREILHMKLIICASVIVLHFQSYAIRRATFTQGTYSVTCSLLGCVDFIRLNQIMFLFLLSPWPFCCSTFLFCFTLIFKESEI